MKKKLIVISAINIFEGGPLSVLKDCLSVLNGYHEIGYNLLVFVHKKKLFLSPHTSKIKFIEIQNSRGSYFTRLYYEYFIFYKISKRIKPNYWFSFHDVTPRLHNTIQFVYCHNPSPFYKPNLKDFFLQPKLLFFKLFYKLLYKIFIHKNKYVIVQQNWIKEKFKKFYNLNSDKIIVSKPISNFSLTCNSKNYYNSDLYYFIYPAFPRPFKNIEMICKCANLLYNHGYRNFKIFLTLDGTENNYSKFIYKRFKNNPHLVFTGALSRNEIFDLYSKVNCLLFPSRLETWGMPLSEFKVFKKPILVSNFPYAKETIGTYDKVKFFNPDDDNQLFNYMAQFLNGTLKYDSTIEIVNEAPFSNTWDDLLKLLITK